MARAAKGVVACGHPDTAAAGVEMLRAGGNAFDAVLAALAATPVTEPALSSLGGGGFMLAIPAGRKPVLYDFFCDTPLRMRSAEDLDFQSVQADFGATVQEFHTGFGSVATPGVAAGIFAIQQDLARFDLAGIFEPAISLARGGVVVNEVQASILQTIEPMMLFSPSMRTVFESKSNEGHTLAQGETLRLPDYAELLHALASDGRRLFYEGDVAAMIETAADDQGGAITRQDMAAYQVKRRQPLERRFANQSIFLNPVPSAGGSLIAFALALIKERLGRLGADRDIAWQVDLAHIMAASDQARHVAGLTGDFDEDHIAELLSSDFILEFQNALAARAEKTGGTTHISVIDKQGNVAALTVSNGESCGHMLPGAGLVLNNMLGEEDLNPTGFFNFQPGTRISSMMSPTIAVATDHSKLVLGSGGSNRIRSAILQVMYNHLCAGLPLVDAVDAPRIHFEREMLNIEEGHGEDVIEHLRGVFDDCRVWPDRNFFFGGVHGAEVSSSGALAGAGDPRRGGIALVV